MNNFDALLSDALREHARETEMSIDMNEAESRLRDSMHSNNRRRGVWTGILAAAAVLLVVAGVVFVLLRPTTNAGPVTQAPSGSQPGFMLDARLLDPPLTATLPFWAALAQGNDASPNGYTYVRKICDTADGLCPDGEDRVIQVVPVRHMYPLDSTTSIAPTYEQLVTAWQDVERLGYGTVSDVVTTTVDGRRATTMRVALTRPPDGLPGCETAKDKKNEGGCLGILPGLTLELAIVDRGAGNPPTLLYEGRNSSNAAQAAAVADEFRTWLSTVQLG